MHPILRAVMESATTLTFAAFLIPMVIIHSWRSVKIKRCQMRKLITPMERTLVFIFLLCITTVEPLSVHLYHFVPKGVATKLPDAALLVWLTANVFSAWCSIVATFTRSYLRALCYIPIVIETFALVFVFIDSMVDGDACMVTIFLAITAIVGVWTIHFVPKMFQTTEAMLSSFDPTNISYALTRMFTAPDA